MHIRSGEISKPWFRADRYYHTNEGWWFLTRENTEEGPYSSQIDAENELMLYIRKIRQFGDYPTV